MKSFTDALNDAKKDGMAFYKEGICKTKLSPKQEKEIETEVNRLGLRGDF